MLIFTSGTSGDPKAVRITHEKVTFPGAYLVERLGLGPDDVFYVSMPLFHSNAVMAGWGPALRCGGTVALAEKFSASGFLADVRRYGATYLNYVGKPLSYVLATPRAPDDADNPLRLAFGNEAGDRDIAAFARRFGCQVVDGFGSTENAVVVSRVPGTPPGSLGDAARGRRGARPGDRSRSARARCSTRPGGWPTSTRRPASWSTPPGTGQFAGYYNDEAATAERMRGGMYWSGDLAYRDEAGLRLLRRAHRRLAARRRREPRRVADRADPGAAPLDRRGRGVRRPRPVLRRPARGRAGARRRPDTRRTSRRSSPRSPTSAPSSGLGTSGSSTRSPAPPPTRCSSGTSRPRGWAAANDGCARSAARRTSRPERRSGLDQVGDSPQDRRDGVVALGRGRRDRRQRVDPELADDDRPIRGNRLPAAASRPGSAAPAPGSGDGRHRRRRPRGRRTAGCSTRLSACASKGIARSVKSPCPSLSHATSSGWQAPKKTPRSWSREVVCARCFPRFLRYAAAALGVSLTSRARASLAEGTSRVSARWLPPEWHESKNMVRLTPSGSRSQISPRSSSMSRLPCPKSTGQMASSTSGGRPCPPLPRRGRGPRRWCRGRSTAARGRRRTCWTRPGP